DLGSAIHPMAMASSHFQTLPLDNFGLEWIQPPVAFVHPFPDGTTYAAYNSVEETAEQFGADAKKYVKLMGNMVKDWEKIGPDLLKGSVSLTLSGSLPGGTPRKGNFPLIF